MLPSVGPLCSVADEKQKERDGERVVSANVICSVRSPSPLVVFSRTVEQEGKYRSPHSYVARAKEGI